MKYEKKVYESALRTRCAERTRAIQLAACVHLLLAPYFSWEFVSGKTWRCKDACEHEKFTKRVSHGLPAEQPMDWIISGTVDQAYQKGKTI